MSTYVVDASVAAKWLLPETHQAQARRLRHVSNSLHAPDFLTLEIGSIVTKKIRRGELDYSIGAMMVEFFRVPPIHLHAWTELFDPAFQLALETRRSLYDCLYLALAQILDGELVTADRKFYDAVQNYPAAARILWVGDIPA